MKKVFSILGRSAILLLAAGVVCAGLFLWVNTAGQSALGGFPGGRGGGEERGGGDRGSGDRPALSDGAAPGVGGQNEGAARPAFRGGFEEGRGFSEGRGFGDRDGGFSGAGWMGLIANLVLVALVTVTVVWLRKLFRWIRRRRVVQPAAG